MIMTVLLILASVFETHIASISMYYLVVVKHFMGRSIDKVVVPTLFGGIVLDILTPRPLGVSAFLAITTLFVGKNIFNLDERSLIWRLYILFIFVLEGLLFGRSYSQIIISILIYLFFILINDVWGNRRSGIVVRREI